jgi:uncharacterized protein (DUF885 family)
VSRAPGSAGIRTVDAIANGYVEDLAAANPLLATYAGIAGHDDEMTDFSPAGFEARAHLARATIDRLRVAEPVDEREQVAKQAMLERLAIDVERHAAGTESRLNVAESPMQDIRQIFDLMPTDGDEAWRNIAARLFQVPDALDGYRATLETSAAQGSVAPRRQVLGCARECRSWTSAEGVDFFTRLAGRCDAADDIRSTVHEGAAAARDAYSRFGHYLGDELAPRAGSRDASGRDIYTLESRFFVGAAIDLEETYRWGWEELARIESEMEQTAARIAPGGSIDDAVTALDADPERVIEGKEQFRGWMQRLADKAVGDLADTHFDIPAPVRRIECRIAPTSDGGIYYTGPSEDFSRPGRMWWAVPEGVDVFSTWREVTTVYHEGVPGHHLQVAQTEYRSELLNRWQRLLCWVSGHGEGWALYAERLMDDLGYLDDPGDRLGMLDGQALRAVRVIIDIGMHLELEIPPDNPYGFSPGRRWTSELGWEFLSAHTRMGEAMRRHELDRYLGWPGQAPSYKVGERIWLAARDDARTRAGDAFDLKAFHRAALDLGSLGLDPLREALARL